LRPAYGNVTGVLFKREKRNIFMFKKAILYLIGGTGILLILSFSNNAMQEKWKAPASADTIRNPLAGDSTVSVTKGAEIFELYCKYCHGELGMGDGPMGAAMDIKPANFHQKEVQDQKDGALFWKMSEGRGGMPPFKDALTAEQRWQLVNFIRALKE
jgi:mono/diheme cytochrome c family protein